MATTLQSHFDEFDSGVVTESGFRALQDAEGYGSASSIGAASACIAKLGICISKKSLSLYIPGEGPRSVISSDGFKEWCEKYLPVSYKEFLSRSGRS